MAGSEPMGEGFQDRRSGLVGKGDGGNNRKYKTNGLFPVPINQPANEQRIEGKPAIAFCYPNHNWIKPGRIMAIEPQKQVSIETIKGL